MRIIVAFASSMAMLAGLPGANAARLSDAPIVRVELHDGCDYHFQMHPAYRADLFFPEQVTYASSGNTTHWDLGAGAHPDSLRAQPAPFAPETNSNVVTVGARISMRLTMTSSRPTANRAILFYEPFTNRPRSERCDPLDDEEVGAVDPERAVAALKPKTRNKIALLFKLHEEKLSNASTRRWTSGKHKLSVRIGSIARGDALFSCKVTLRNHGDFAYPLTGLEVLDTTLMRDRLDQRVVDSPDGELPAQLGAKQVLTLVLSATEPALLSRGWVLRLLPGTGLAPAEFRLDGESPFPRPFKKLTVGLDGRGGTARMAQDGNRAFTMARSIGLRARYGVLRHVALEGAIGYVQTGQAELDGSMTSLAGARVMASGVFTFGDRIAPFVRGGFGIVPAALTRQGESQFDIFPVLSAGVGVDAWIGRALVVGVSLDGMGGSGDMPLTLDASVHVSYALDFLGGWN